MRKRKILRWTYEQYIRRVEQLEGEQQFRLFYIHSSRIRAVLDQIKTWKYPIKVIYLYHERLHTFMYIIEVKTTDKINLY